MNIWDSLSHAEFMAENSET